MKFSPVVVKRVAIENKSGHTYYGMPTEGVNLITNVDCKLAALCRRLCHHHRRK